MDAPALVASLHGAKNSASVSNALKLNQHRLFDNIGQLINDGRTLQWVLGGRQAPLLVDDHLNRKGTAHRLLRWGGYRLVKCIGVKGICVVIERTEGLQRSADVVEVHLLSVQRSPGGLYVVLKLLRTITCPVLVAHRDSPNPSSYPPKNRVFGVHPIGKEKRKIWCEIIYCHPACQICLYIRKPIGQGESQLTYRVGPGLSNVVAAD